jgi:hypothetical protein
MDNLPVAVFFISKSSPNTLSDNRLRFRPRPEVSFAFDNSRPDAAFCTEETLSIPTGGELPQQHINSYSRVIHTRRSPRKIRRFINFAGEKGAPRERGAPAKSHPAYTS